jgi:hypothetical protein
MIIDKGSVQRVLVACYLGRIKVPYFGNGCCDDLQIYPANVPSNLILYQRYDINIS